MTDLQIKLLPLEVLPITVNGTSWGAKRNVVLRIGSKLMFWRPGLSVWSGTGCPWRYAAASTIMIDGEDYGSHRYLMESGRLSRRSIALRAQDIDLYFGLEGAGVRAIPLLRFSTIRDGQIS
jgi:hypothetical protein